MAKVLVNGNIKSGDVLKEVIENEPHLENSNIAIIRGIKKETEKESKKYKITTTKGVMIVGITENNESVDFWNKNYSLLEGKNLRWKSPLDVAFGAITIDLDVVKEPYKFKKYDVALSISGFDKTEGHLIFIKKDATEAQGLRNPKIGELIGGKRILPKLTTEDKIISIEPIMESREKIDYLLTTDLNTKLEDDWKIFTYCEAELEGPSKAVEHVLAIMESGYIEASEHTNTYIADCRLQTLKMDEENLKDRDRGTITVRNIGEGIGKVFVYKENRTSSLSHTAVGKITKGMELLDFSEGGIITTISTPERLTVIGKTNEEAKKLFEKYGINHTMEGAPNDIIIEQTPKYTMDILKSKEVITKGIPENKIIKIEIYDEKAPVSAWYFRKMTGLTTQKVGSLPINFKHGDMVMFDKNEEYAKGLLPENIPNEETGCPEGVIAITNMAKRYKGYIGIRLSSNDKFGPTGESFEGTNIVGKVVENGEIIKKLRAKDRVYFLEVNQ
ncbi:conserved hypothetical protein [Methanococcus aeolicus Nankai-3]|uniref:UPF0288 protein Maeo_0995 n=1 Tax=Methanococcus aeolicus (strain ATCC BAA-1280 / DSM 17508 / OCM 812 / Nankai-3) TaxID=419665 RepID=Y995_META3|nr:methanogenesis marker 3 protein [Methanococcus aeolicus]A6UVQ1.1 RecName: Full=UPF0288 protein Maeo_0995 [Methanococcus aeolicus Nankai-3]ABR56573.1 conserved hypothetical protein [Methanococcus aeolicus Nankai-3]